MSTALCPPHKTVHSAIIRISSRSCRPALPVRGSSRPSKQAMNPSMSRLPPTASKTPRVEAIASQHASLNALAKLFQVHFPCDTGRAWLKSFEAAGIVEALLFIGNDQGVGDRGGRAAKLQPHRCRMHRAADLLRRTTEIGLLEMPER